MNRPALYQAHVALGAKFAVFAGWEMPVQYSSVLAEHKAVRERAGLFDVSHLGNVFVSGPRAGDYLDSVFPGKVAGLAEGTAGYNLLLNRSGGIIDDLFIYRRASDFMVVPNASNTKKVAAILEAGAGRGIEVKDRSGEWTILAFSGPLVKKALGDRVPELRLHRFVSVDSFGPEAMVARTGYTGERTFEFIVPAQSARFVWDLLIDLGQRVEAEPAGLAARDLLRLEMGYPLHGADIGKETTPLEAGLGWLIDWDKKFTGSDSLRAARDRGVARSLTGLVGKGREIPRAGCTVFLDGKKIGTVTSGNFSPALRTGVALAYLPPAACEPGTIAAIEVRGRMLEAEVVKPPFIRK